jgi:hypothetical protein
VSNINFDIRILFCGGGTLLISHEKYIKDGNVLAHLGFQSNQYGNSGNDVVICRVGNIPEHDTSLNIQVDI